VGVGSAMANWCRNIGPYTISIWRTDTEQFVFRTLQVKLPDDLGNLVSHRIGWGLIAGWLGIIVRRRPQPPTPASTVPFWRGKR
jgi:hypothetical protein